jgi:hypothetical protein
MSRSLREQNRRIESAESENASKDAIIAQLNATLAVKDALLSSMQAGVATVRCHLFASVGHTLDQAISETKRHEVKMLESKRLIAEHDFGSIGTGADETEPAFDPTPTQCSAWSNNAEPIFGRRMSLYEVPLGHVKLWHMWQAWKMWHMAHRTHAVAQRGAGSRPARRLEELSQARRDCSGSHGRVI